MVWVVDYDVDPEGFPRSLQKGTYGISGRPVQAKPNRPIGNANPTKAA